jgi:hypothetical protein
VPSRTVTEFDEGVQVVDSADGLLQVDAPLAENVVN